MRINHCFRNISRLRAGVQLVWTALCNGYLAGFFKGTIYSGPLKGVCVPGLNCYSCPGALGACPVGSFQAMLTGMEPRFPSYVLGFLIAFGAVLGRFVCGWLCPFGLVQDTLHKVPVQGKRRGLPGDRTLRLLKYAVLALFVVALPLCVRDELLNVSDPWFCKYICPSGTLLGGWPLLAANESLRGAAGALFAWKSALLIGIVALSVWTYRPFCKYLCPLGAVYGFFNPFALLGLSVDRGACVDCGACARACPMDVKMPALPDSAECIRCGKCAQSCPTGAVRMPFEKKRDRKREESRGND